ncbi:MAG: D-aminoacyl-tRNA deacylase [Cyclobacteriaceae bacterium]
MRAVVQRVKSASVVIDSKTTAQIDKGLLVLLGVEEVDTQEDIDWLVRKIINMRIFHDREDKMNLSLLDVEGSLLIVSQFTLHASTKKGNRPSFTRAAHPEKALPLYEEFVAQCRKEVSIVQTGEFGADMKVTLLNDGPVTIIMDSMDKQ